MMQSIVVPAKAGIHNHRSEFWLMAAPQEKAIHTVLNKNLHGVWGPAFAGTTVESES
jgi:hypothetical protein